MKNRKLLPRESETHMQHWLPWAGGILTLLAISTLANGQMLLPAPSDHVPGLPLNHTEFRGIDTNGDGFENTIYGVPYYDEENPEIGEVHVLSTSDPNDDIVIYGEQLNDGFGFPAVGIADVSFNGNHDIAIGALNWHDGADAVGKVYIVRGSDGAIMHTFVGDEPDALFGFAIASVGDVTGDSVSDIAVGAPHAGPNQEGRVYLYSGLTGALIDTFPGALHKGMFGVSISGAGDLNGDGYPEIIVGAPVGTEPVLSSDPVLRTSLGRAYIFSGQTGALLCTIKGDAQDGRLGFAVAGGEDVTGDNAPDILVAAPTAANSHWSMYPPPPDPHSYGRVYLFSASTFLASGGQLAASDADVTILPFHEGDVNFGGYVAIGNDVTLDGLPNVIVGSIFETDGEDPFPLGGDSEEWVRINAVSGVDGAAVLTYVAGEELDGIVGYYEPVDGHCHPPEQICAIACEEMFAHCPNPGQLCICLGNQISAYNINTRTIARYTVGGGLLTGIACGAVFIPPLTAGAAPLCFTLGTGTILGSLGWAVSENISHSNNWHGCFTDNGCLANGSPWDPIPKH